MTQSELNQEWSKQRRRIRRFLTSAGNRGFEFDYTLPERPAQITQDDVDNLKSITPQSLYQRAVYVDQDTGEVISGTAGRTLERQGAARKGIARKQAENRFRYYQLVVLQYQTYIQGFPPSISGIVLKALNTALRESGTIAVARRLQDTALSLSDFLNRTRMYGDSIQAAIEYATALFGDLPGMTDEDVLDAIDAAESEESP